MSETYYVIKCDGNFCVCSVGSSMGIGAATAVEMARHGGKLTITGLPGDDLSKTVNDCVKAGAKPENVSVISTMYHMI